MGTNFSRLPPSTDTISQHATEPAEASGSNVPPRSGPPESSAPGRSQTLPRATDGNGNRRFSRLVSRFSSLGRNNTGGINRAPLTTAANQPQSPAPAIDQSVQTVPVQHADAASATQAEVASQNSSTDNSGVEPASRSPSLREAFLELGWVLPLVDDEYQPETGNAVPAATTASAAPTTDDGLPNFAAYGRPFSLDIAVREALRPINPLVTTGLTLNTVVKTGTVGPALDMEMVKAFNLSLRLEHRFVEMEIDGQRRTFVFSYDSGKKLIESVHLVEYEEDKKDKKDKKDEKDDEASPTALRSKQTVTINGVEQKLSVQRAPGSGRLVRVVMPEFWVRARVKAFAEGAQTRAAQQREFQAITPYPNRAHYALATRAFSGKKGISPERTAHTVEEWNVYRSSRAVSLLKERSAVLHSFRMKGHRDGTLAELEAPPREGEHAVRPLGHIYRPEKIHNMKVNAAWMLGLAHHQIPAVLTTPLTAELLSRGARDADNADPLSAMCRELVGLLQNGYFRVETNQFGKKKLVPTEAAKAATLDSMRVPPKGDLNEIVAFLEQNNLPVLSKAEDLPGTTSRFNAAHWWSALLLDDLQGQDNSFPNLNTLIYSGVQVPVLIFEDVLTLLKQVTWEGFEDFSEEDDSSDARDSVDSQQSRDILKSLLASKEPETRIPALLMAMVNGMTDDVRASECLAYLADHVPFFNRTRTTDHVAEKIIDCIHRRTIEIGDVRIRMNLLHRLMRNIIASEVTGTSEGGEDFPLLAHALNAKVVNPHYQRLPIARVTDLVYEKLPLAGALCGDAVDEIDTVDHPDTKRAIALGLKVFDSLKSVRERFIGLNELAYGIRNSTEPDERKWFANAVMARLSPSADDQDLNSEIALSPDDQDMITQKVGYSLILVEVDGGNTDAEEIMDVLKEFKIPMRRDLAFAAIDDIQSKSGEEQYVQLELATELVKAAPPRDNEEISEKDVQQLIRFIDAFGSIKSGKIVEHGSDEAHELIEFAVDFIRAYLDGASESTSTWEKIEVTLIVSLIGISTLETQQAVKILQKFGVPDSEICLAAFTQLDRSSSPDDAHALNFVGHVADTMGAEKRAEALQCLLRRLRKFPSFPGAKEITETVAAQIIASQSPDALDPMSEYVCADLTLDLACSLVNFNVLQHQNALDMLVACASVRGGRELMAYGSETGIARITGDQMKGINVIFEHIDRMRTAEEHETDDRNVQVLGYLVQSLPEITENYAEVFDALQMLLETASNAPMTERDRRYLTQELINSLRASSHKDHAIQFALIDRIDRNLEKVKESNVAVACQLARELIDAGQYIYMANNDDEADDDDDDIAWRTAAGVVANCFGMNMELGGTMTTGEWSDFVLDGLPE